MGVLELLDEEESYDELDCVATPLRWLSLSYGFGLYLMPLYLSPQQIHSQSLIGLSLGHVVYCGI